VHRIEANAIKRTETDQVSTRPLTNNDRTDVVSERKKHKKNRKESAINNKPEQEQQQQPTENIKPTGNQHISVVETDAEIILRKLEYARDGSKNFGPPEILKVII